MPKINHPNFGDVQSYKFLEGIVTEVHSDTDTADVTIPGLGNVEGIPIHYHCNGDTDSVQGGSSAFSVDDSVIVRVKIGSTDPQDMRVLGFTDGPKRCGSPILYACARLNTQGPIIQRYPLTGETPSLGAQIQLSSPRATYVAGVKGDNFFYASVDRYPYEPPKIYKLNGETLAIESTLSAVLTNYLIRDLIAFKDGYLYAVGRDDSKTSGVVAKIDATSGAVVAKYTSFEKDAWGGYDHVLTGCLGDDGYLYVPCIYGDWSLHKIDPSTMTRVSLRDPLRTNKDRQTEIVNVDIPILEGQIADIEQELQDIYYEIQDLQNAIQQELLKSEPNYAQIALWQAQIDGLEERRDELIPEAQNADDQINALYAERQSLITAANGACIHYVAWGPDGLLYASGENNKALKMNPVSLGIIDSFTGPAGAYPDHVFFDDAGYLILLLTDMVSAGNNTAMYRIDTADMSSIGSAIPIMAAGYNNTTMRPQSGSALDGYVYLSMAPAVSYSGHEDNYTLERRSLDSMSHRDIIVEGRTLLFHEVDTYSE